ncbi:e9cf3065-90ff-48b7-9078-acd988178954 [Thermothielavioides terrestris]|uniref:E9cf3065-90ff-48b7-9078-acd988178954 n=1 Tax=Thermothielavioides terrestris TaxID=2587410 RepID=A0A446BEN6_9PEZI|nr:e9cf3065-90ff-48b7-9078-acd988178954 [Thermothielavioides terrestris]
MEADFQLFSSLRYDPVLLQVPASNLTHAGWNWVTSSPLYMLDYHRDRMLQAAAHWGWQAAVEVLDGDAGLKRLAGFVMDSIGGNQPSPLRTTKRAVYDGARQRAQISLADKKEVLIVNEADGTVMEGSTTTPYFWREGRWVTPAVNMEDKSEKGAGGQNGTSRRWALEKGLAVEGTILASSLVHDEECWLSNGVRGFFFGRVKLK